MSFSLLVFAILAGAAFCSAQSLSLSIKAVDGRTVSEAVPFEIVDYELLLANNSGSDVQGLNILLKADEGLAIITLGKEFRERKFYAQSLKAGENYSAKFSIKVTAENKSLLRISASYGFGDKLESGQKLEIKVIGQQINIREEISSKPVKAGQKGIFKASVKNVSNEKLGNLSVVLSGSNGAIVESNSRQFDYLEAGIETPVQEFEFYYGNEGKKEIALQIGYEDSKGKHLVEKRHLLEEGMSPSFYILIVLAFGVLIAGIAYYLKGRKEETRS